MKFSLSWLKYYLETDATIEQVADCLNRIGLEVEGIENPADKLAGFRVRKACSPQHRTHRPTSCRCSPSIRVTAIRCRSCAAHPMPVRDWSACSESKARRCPPMAWC